MRTWIAPALFAGFSYLGALLAESELGSVAKYAVAVFFAGVAFVCYSIDKSRDGGAK